MFVKVFLLGCIFFPPSVAEKQTHLRIIHVNDIHARITQTHQYPVNSRKCSEKEGHVCYGGMPRLIAASNAELNRAKEEGVPVIFLCGGDTLHGSALFGLIRWQVVSNFMNLLKLDAMGLGKHEFIDGVNELDAYVSELHAPVLACNVYVRPDDDLRTLLKPSVTITIGNMSIGIIGYIYHKIYISQSEHVTLKDEITCIEEEAKKLKANGVNIIIGLGHCPFERDLEIAEAVKDLNVIVGSYDHVFLYTGDPPDIEIPIGLYPTLVTEKSGTSRIVPVVQAYAFTKYLGVLDVVFNDKWEVISAYGNPILLNSKIKQDEEALTMLNNWQAFIQNMTSRVIGITRVPLSGNCSFEECNLGNLITDAFVHYAAEYLKENEKYIKSNWSDVSIAIYQAGGIVDSLNPPEGRITLDDIILAMPYLNKLGIFSIKGKYLLEALEWSVANYNRSKARLNEFLQVSGSPPESSAKFIDELNHSKGWLWKGLKVWILPMLMHKRLHVTYDLSQPVGGRVVRVTARARHASNNITAYSPLDLEESYAIVVGTSISRGDDGYDVLRNNLKPIKHLHERDSYVVSLYCEEKKFLYLGIEERIVINSSPTKLSMRLIIPMLCAIYHICY